MQTLRATILAAVAISFGTSIVTTGCSSLPTRNPLPSDLVEFAQIPGIANARAWADEPYYDDVSVGRVSPEEARERYPMLVGQPVNGLAISGGGQNGAFAVGLLNGWSASGTRPEFTLVTGVSTGALIAPFAFLGSEYDQLLKEVYTSISSADLMRQRGVVRTVVKDAAADTTPLRRLIERHFDEDFLSAIAKEYAKGRQLDIITTNLDAARAVRWNIGAIASSDEPGRLELIRDVIRASAAIPGAFPPVMIAVEANGTVYDEMHVDGGVSTLVTAYPMATSAREYAEIMRASDNPTMYVIRNGYSTPKYQPVDRRTLPIVVRTISAFFGSVAVGDLYRIFLETRRDDVEFRLAAIPESFRIEPDEMFDPDYMSALYDLAYELASSGYPWQTSLEFHDRVSR